MANACPRCGHIAASDGHATFGEWQECVEAFAFAQQLAKWTAEWKEWSHQARTPAIVTRRLPVDFVHWSHHQCD